jgi:hypothetical protein
MVNARFSLYRRRMSPDARIMLADAVLAASGAALDLLDEALQDSRPVHALALAVFLRPQTWWINGEQAPHASISPAPQLRLGRAN